MRHAPVDGRLLRADALRGREATGKRERDDQDDAGSGAAAVRGANEERRSLQPAIDTEKNEVVIAIADAAS